MTNRRRGAGTAQDDHRACWQSVGFAGHGDCIRRDRLAWTICGNLVIGGSGTGTLTIQNRGTVTDGAGFIGNLPGGLGTVTVTGAGSSWSNAGDVVVGGLGTGALTIQDSGTVNSGGGGSVGIVCRLDWYGDGDRTGLHLEQRYQAAGSISAVLAPARSRSRPAGRSSITPPSPPTSAKVQARGYGESDRAAPCGATLRG